MGLSRLAAYYRICATADGKAPKTIELMTSSVMLFERFLASEGRSTSVAEIGPGEIRGFILHLKRRACFSNHPYARPQARGLSPHTVNSYLRSVRAFWSWLEGEGIIIDNPFERIRIPRAPGKVMPTFSNSQLNSLFAAIDTSTREGLRDYVIVITLLDTAMRVSELSGMKLTDLRLDDAVVKVMGKGSKERLIPFGKYVRRLLWRYLNDLRPEPLNPRCENVFLTTDGWPMTGKYIRSRMARYGRRAGLEGIRCSPHTLRSTAAVSFLRNGGDVFSLQRLLGHASLSMTRHYCELADIDVQRAHATASPVDNLMFADSPHRHRLHHTRLRYENPTGF